MCLEKTGKIYLKNGYGQYLRRIIETIREILLDVLDMTIGRRRACVFSVCRFENRVMPTVSCAHPLPTYTFSKHTANHIFSQYLTIYA